MRIAIVNDITIAVEVLRRVVMSNPKYKIAWIAKNGQEAIDKCKEDTPDLILMDLIMPLVDGVKATSVIMRESPCAILVVTAFSTNSSKVFEAMGGGALDVVATPCVGLSGEIDGAERLLKKIATMEKLILSKGKTFKENYLPKSEDNFPLIAIGSSTGGPKALAEILSELPVDLGAAIVIVQHVDERFAGELVSWLDNQCKLKVELALEGSVIKKNVVYVAGTNDHLFLEANRKLSYKEEPKDYPYRPSVDVFFKSLLANWQRKDIALLLTGMGKDGAEGLLKLRNAFWTTIAQDKDTSVVYGMPKAAFELGAAVKILPVHEIARELIKQVYKKGTLDDKY